MEQMDAMPGHDTRQPAMMPHPYRDLALQTLAGGVIMYLVMFVMIDGLSSFFNNLNMAYMTLMMLAPMVVIMILAMGLMYPDKRLNATLVSGSILVFLACFAAIRTQATIGDRQFLRSMIPHHSGAVLMCREATLTDAEIKQLCAGIIKGQRAEIEQMEAILARR